MGAMRGRQRDLGLPPSPPPKRHSSCLSTPTTSPDQPSLALMQATATATRRSMISVNRKIRPVKAVSA